MSAFEFLRYWRADALAPPSQREAKSRTEWTEDGQAIITTLAFREGRAKLLPGVHYKVREEAAEGDEYWVFPREPRAVFEVLRHSWAIVRRPRPFVPILENAALPSPSKPRQENAKYLSVFFRPWTLLSGTSARSTTPHLATLGLHHLREGSASAAGASRGSAAAGTVADASDFAASWPSFLRAGVHSQEAARLIPNAADQRHVRPRARGGGGEGGGTSPTWTRISPSLCAPRTCARFCSGASGRAQRKPPPRSSVDAYL